MKNWARSRRRTLASRSRREADSVSEDRHAEATRRRDATHVPSALRVGAAPGRLRRCDSLTMRSVASPSWPRLAYGHPALPTRPDPVLQRAANVSYFHCTRSRDRLCPTWATLTEMVRLVGRTGFVLCSRRSGFQHVLGPIQPPVQGYSSSRKCALLCRHQSLHRA